MKIHKLLYGVIMVVSLSASSYSQTTIDSWIDKIKQCDSEECQKNGLIVLKDSLLRTLGVHDFPSEYLCKYVNVNLTETIKHGGNLNLDFCQTITETRDVADRRYADMLMGYVINNSNQLVYYGDDGGGNVDYCPLSRLSILILKDIIKDFPYVPQYYELIDEKKESEIRQWCKKHQKVYEMNIVP